jgi:hypothetical protein
MIDYSNEVFNVVAENLRSLYSGVQVIGEYVETPAKFPTVTLDEVNNVPIYLDSGDTNKYARVMYRCQVFCNGDGKRKKARTIYDSVDRVLMSLGLVAKSYSTTPAIYNSEIYCITATYEGVIGKDGVIYRN